MKKLFNLAALCVVTSLVLGSCSSDSGTTTTPADKNYYPTTVGSTWTYDGVDTEDTTGTLRTIPGSEYTTTTTVNASLTYMGKASTQLISTSSQPGSTPDTTYISKTSSQIYTYVQLLPTASLAAFGVNLDLGSRWMLIGDFNATSWTVIDTTIKGISIPNPLDPTSTIPADIVVKITGAKGGTSTMTVMGSSITAQEFTTTFSISLSALGGLVQLPISVATKTSVAENIGIVKNETPPFSITLPALLGGTKLNNNGNRETIKTYVIAK
ncbi:MAG: hypothetical protein U0264_10155 [Candidatus Kapaibacterium sp.]